MSSKVRPTLVAIIALAVLVGALGGCDRQSQETLRVGDPMPVLTLERLEGGTMESVEWNGRTVLVNVWATWCGPCREEMPAFEALSRSLDPDQYQVVAVSLDTDRNLIREFALEYKLTFPLLVDPEGVISKAAFGVQVVPETLIFDPSGRLMHRVRGQRDWAAEEMRRRLITARGRT